MYRPTHNSSGFSLIEVLISVAAIAILAMGAAKVSADLVKTGVATDANQHRTNIDQSLNSVFENPEICSTILSGTTSVNGSVVILPQSLHMLDALKRIKIQSMKLAEVQDLGNNNFRADIDIVGSKLGPSGSEENFSDQIPVYYLVNSGKISNCYSEKSAYSTCLALKGEWKETYCDFCAGLGGTRDATGKCSIAKSPDPTPTIPTPNKKFAIVRVQSGYNGVRTHGLGKYKQCNLQSYVYDGDGIGECTVTGTSGGGWYVTVGDEGTRHPQICYMACVYSETENSTAGNEDGDTCVRNGKTGVMVNGCCAIGTQFKRNYEQRGSYKERWMAYIGTSNDVVCVP
jgi:prepilin-type N-terminal cleavage/methylation domain